MKAIRDRYNLSLQETKKIINNLPYQLSDFSSKKEEILKDLDGVADFDIKIDKLSTDDQEGNRWLAPWEKPEYIAAQKWYLSLPREDQEKIDILVGANVAQG